ncbi:MAG: HepT-like ribonuclease domain-containing protein [Burkholderiales bacterium]
MRLEARKYLLDIQIAADRIGRFTRGKSFREYLAEEMLRSAVERQFGIVGEALSRLSKDDADVAAAIPDHAKIIAFRNILVHGYATVDDRIVWGVIENYLARLQAAVKRLLDTPG